MTIALSGVTDVRAQLREQVFAELDRAIEAQQHAPGKFIAIKCPHCSAMVPQGGQFCCRAMRDDYMEWFKVQKAPATETST